jgi:ribonuclease HI
MKEIICFFDGCCEPKNPGGNMGYGSIVIIDGEIVLEWSGFDPAMQGNTNNIAEYKSLEKILDYLLENDLTGENILIKGDSQLTVKQMNGEYGINAGGYVPFAKRCLLKKARFKKLPKFEWIPRHLNEDADKLSKSELIKQTGYDENVLQFGKYKGKKISEITDMGYLNWALENVNMQKSIKEKIQKRISEYEFLSK